MEYDAEELISKCVEGRAPRDILKLIEEELPDVSSICRDLLRDLNRIGFYIESSDIQEEGTCIKVSIDARIMEKCGSEIMSIADTYSRTYQEIEVLVAVKL